MRVARRFGIVPVFLGMLMIVACSAAEAPSGAPGDGPFWPRFHGPDGDNKSPDTGLLKSWPEDGPPLLWTAEGIGSGYSSVSLAGGMIYTAGNKDDKTMITALDLSGNILWQVPNGEAWTKSHEGTRGTPTVDGDRLYHQSPLGELVCLNARTGEKMWGVNVLDEYDGSVPEWALAESLLVDGDRLISCPFGKKASVVALDKMTGREVWKAPGTGEKAGYSTPTLARQGDLRMILVLNSKALVGVNADTGDLLFRYPHETKYDVNVLKPIFRDGKVFVSSGYGSGSELIRLDVDGGQVTAEQVWQSKELDNHHGGVLYLDGHLYGSSFSGKWVCLDWETGETLYSEKGVGKGSLTYADGMLYTLSERYKMGLVKATPEAHEVISEFRLPEGGENLSWAHPVVIGGRLYVRHDNFLYAYDVTAR